MSEPDVAGRLKGIGALMVAPYDSDSRLNRLMLHAVYIA
jgi:hypothetical protein